MSKPVKRRLTPEITRQIAEVAGLDVDEQRAAELTPQLQALRDALEAMDALDLTDVEPPVAFHPASGAAP